MENKSAKKERKMSLLHQFHFIVEGIILVSLSLDPTVINAEEALFLPKTSLLLVKLAPVCSTSFLNPPNKVNLDFRFNITLTRPLQ